MLKYYEGELSLESLLDWGDENVYDFGDVHQIEDAFILNGHEELVIIRKKDKLIERVYIR
jgi:hypothetical protein